MAYKPDNDYIEVSERIKLFYEKYPQGRLVCNEAPLGMRFGEQEFVAVHARAYRTPDDQHPGDGWAWEPVPGPTPYTKNSELMNAQTAAVGRAIVSVGLLASRNIASKEEVEARKGESEVKSKPKAKKKPEGISADDVKALEPAVRSWLKAHPDKRDDFRMKIIGLGVVEPDVDLPEILGQLPNREAVEELQGWFNEQE